MGEGWVVRAVQVVSAELSFGDCRVGKFGLGPLWTWWERSGGAETLGVARVVVSARSSGGHGPGSSRGGADCERAESGEVDGGGEELEVGGDLGAASHRACMPQWRCRIRWASLISTLFMFAR